MRRAEAVHLREAVRLAEQNVTNGGGPFGCVIVREGRIIARGVNRVTATNDPTAHAEIVAIREACRMLETFHLEGCDIYASCEPCPMCLGAIYWARPARVMFAASRAEAAAAGFDDERIYHELPLPLGERSLATIHLPIDERTGPFEAWARQQGRTQY
ncbi:MAG: nucleoside deaminase [Bacteroidetes bacterium]|nr:nucleoside deaminase [Bacteroidota bacterium]